MKKAGGKGIEVMMGRRVVRHSAPSLALGEMAPTAEQMTQQSVAKLRTVDPNKEAQAKFGETISQVKQIIEIAALFA